MRLRIRNLRIFQFLIHWFNEGCTFSTSTAVTCNCMTSKYSQCATLQNTESAVLGYTRCPLMYSYKRRHSTGVVNPLLHQSVNGKQCGILL